MTKEETKPVCPVRRGECIKEECAWWVKKAEHPMNWGMVIDKNVPSGKCVMAGICDNTAIIATLVAQTKSQQGIIRG